MSPNYKAKKVNKKQRRCEAIIRGECDIESSEVPTRFLAILNAGHCTGLTEERALAAATAHGMVVQLVMLPNRSYCFLECISVRDAEQIFDGMHNVAHIGQNGAVTYLAYFMQLPATVENIWQRALPTGLLVLPDFITTEEEDVLLAAVGLGSSLAYKTGDAAALEAELKHRRVKHFGYEFIYGENKVDPGSPLQQQIPAECDFLWPRLQTEMAVRNENTMDWQIPDQLTVNEYTPGQGIPAHVDTHSAFLDPILSLSLLGDVVMDFRRGADRVPVLLRRRSLLVMSGQARYDWTHGITPRVLDVVPTPTGTLTTQARVRRVSCTFRRLRRGPCDCSFPTLCDTRIESTSNQPTNVTDAVATQLEELNVHRVYECIAPHFNETRHTPWPRVAEFLHSFAAGSVVVDVGCGNGKYLQCNGDALTMGCDRSSRLLQVCIEKSANVFRCDCLQLPIRTASIDGCISVAVIHHLATAERRLAAIREMARLLRKHGRALIYVWAKRQNTVDNNKSSYLRQNKAVNKQRVTVDQQRQRAVQELQQQHNQLSNSVALELPIHTNRTDFLQQDVLVPWKLKSKAATEQHATPATYLRYYHVFKEQELQQLVAQLPEVRLLHSYYDQGNHCVVFERQ